MLSLEKRRLGGDLTALLSCLKGSSGELGAGLFCHVSRDRTRDSGLKSPQEKFRLNTRRNFCSEIVARHWHRLTGRWCSHSPGGVQETWRCGTEGCGLVGMVEMRQWLDQMILEVFPTASENLLVY